MTSLAQAQGSSNTTRTLITSAKALIGGGVTSGVLLLFVSPIPYVVWLELLLCLAIGAFINWRLTKDLSRRRRLIVLGLHFAITLGLVSVPVYVYYLLGGAGPG